MTAHHKRASTFEPAAPEFIARERAFGARNYDPLPVVLSQGDGAWVTDVDGRRYLDLMSAYSAVSFGHGHPAIVGALVAQVRELAVTSRAFYNDKLPLLLERVTRLTGLPRALPANGGAEAVETALKAMRKWAYKVKGVPADRAEVIVCANNFHGRSITIVGFSSEAQYRDGFGPFPPGFVTIPYGDASALAAAITPNTAAFLVEPIQGEGGIIVPPDGYLAECARICRERNVLLICDEIQTGLGRTGAMLACRHDNVMPDGIILGKALGGGLLPVSMFVATEDVMQVFTPGDHGSTFGGNPLASAVALAALDVLEREDSVRALGIARHVAPVGVAQDRQPAGDRRARARIVHRHRGRHCEGQRTCRRRRAARARNPVEGYARHGGAHRAAAGHGERGSGVGGGGDRRGVAGPPGWPLRRHDRRRPLTSFDSSYGPADGSVRIATVTACLLLPRRELRKPLAAWSSSTSLARHRHPAPARSCLSMSRNIAGIAMNATTSSRVFRTAVAQVRDAELSVPGRHRPGVNVCARHRAHAIAERLDMARKLGLELGELLA